MQVGGNAKAVRTFFCYVYFTLYHDNLLHIDFKSKLIIHHIKKPIIWNPKPLDNDAIILILGANLVINYTCFITKFLYILF